MPREASGPLTFGDQVEARVGAVWFWEGTFARTGIDLTRKFGHHTLQVTDLDLLAFEFGPTYVSRKYIGESKTGNGRSAPKALDRLVWLRGLRALVQADGAELTMRERADSRSRELGRGLAVRIQSLSDLGAREESIGAALLDVGPYGPEAVVMRERARQSSLSEPSFAAAYKILRSTIWLEDEFMMAKQSIAIMEQLSSSWSDALIEEDDVALRWLFAESVSAFVLAVTLIAGHRAPMDSLDFETYVTDKLSAGVIPAADLRRLSGDIDKYLAGLLVAVNAPPTVRVSAMGAFQPTSPRYAAALAELATRLRREYRPGATLAQAEILVHERVVRAREVRQDVADRLDLGVGGRTEVGAVAAFLRTYASLPDAVSAALTNQRVEREASSGAGLPTVFEFRTSN